MIDTDFLELYIIVGAYNQIVDTTANGRGEIGGQEYWALRATHEGRIHHFLMRMDNGRVWSAEFTVGYSSQPVTSLMNDGRIWNNRMVWIQSSRGDHRQGIPNLIRFSGDHNVFMKDIALLRMFVDQP